MKISLVTISLNQSSFLNRCIESVLSQDYKDVEYIVVDPGSTDSSREIIESYGVRVLPLFKPDHGPAQGLNNGFALATGDVFGFINADDYLLPGALDAVARYFGPAPGKRFMTGCGYIERPNGVRQLIRPTKLTVHGLLYKASIIFQQSTFFTSELYKESGGFNPSNRTCWDFELFSNFLLCGGEHEVIRQKLGVFSYHPDSITGSGRLNKMYQDDRKRIFRDITGRSWMLSDEALSMALRVLRKLSLRYEKV